LNFELKTLSESPDIRMVTINKNKKAGDRNYRMFVAFGQHAREMIAVETGMYFLNAICGAGDLGDINEDDMNDALGNYELRMVMNANPEGRKKVEEGAYCWRSNKDKVDPNRNWSYNFKVGDDEDKMYDSYGGEEALTAVETRVLDE